jgi:hypothetical protein
MDGELEGQVRELLRRSEGLEWGPTRVMLAEEAVRLADRHGDAKLGYEARQVLIQAAVFSDLDERAVGPFTWCLAAQDRDPKRFPDGHTLLWQYKWIIGSADEWPQIPLERLHAMIDDMEARHRQAGFSARSAYRYRLGLAGLMHDAALGRTLFPKWRSAPRDAMADCPACERNVEVRYWNLLGDDGRLLEAAAPILGGALRCTVVPRITYAEVLLPLVRLGRLDEAMAYHEKGHRLSARNTRWVEDAARHIRFLTLTDHPVRAVHMLESHFPFPHDPIAADRYPHFEFALAARFLFERLGAAGRETIKLRLHPSFPAHQEAGRYDVALLESWFEAEARRLGGLFDARHGNDGFRRWIDANLALKELVRPFPLKPARSDRSST